MDTQVFNHFLTQCYNVPQVLDLALKSNWNKRYNSNTVTSLSTAFYCSLFSSMFLTLNATHQEKQNAKFIQ